MLDRMNVDLNWMNIISSMWCDIGCVHWLLNTVLRHVMFMKSRSFRRVLLCRGHFRKVLWRWCHFRLKDWHKADEKWWRLGIDYCDLRLLMITCDLLVNCDWYTFCVIDLLDIEINLLDLFGCCIMTIEPWLLSLVSCAL